MTFLICFNLFLFLNFFSRRTDYVIKFYLRKLNLHMYFDYTYESRNTWMLTTKLGNIVRSAWDYTFCLILFVYLKMGVYKEKEILLLSHRNLSVLWRTRHKGNCSREGFLFNCFPGLRCKWLTRERVYHVQIKNKQLLKYKLPNLLWQQCLA